MTDQYLRAIADAVARIAATTIVPGESPEMMLGAIAGRVADLAKPTNHAVEQGQHEAPPPMAWCSDAARDVLAERRRQVEAEGWTPEHDDEHAHGELADAAACYALQHGCLPSGMDITGDAWPFGCGSFKPGDRRRDLVKAGALILAEIERLDRAKG